MTPLEQECCAIGAAIAIEELNKRLDAKYKNKSITPDVPKPHAEKAEGMPLTISEQLGVQYPEKKPTYGIIDVPMSGISTDISKIVCSGLSSQFVNFVDRAAVIKKIRDKLAIYEEGIKAVEAMGLQLQLEVPRFAVALLRSVLNEIEAL